MQLKTLIILALIAIIAVGLSFFVVSKGLIPFGKPEEGTDVAQTESEESEGDEQLSDNEELSNNEELSDNTVETNVEEEEEEVAGPSIAEAADKLPDIEIIPLEPIVVNLRGSFGRRYLKVTVNLGIEKEEPVEEEDKKKKKKEKEGEDVSFSAKEIIESKLIEIRDILISLLSSKSIDDVGGWANQDIIRNEIKDRLNRKLQLDKGISKVYFTEFVIQ